MSSSPPGRQEQNVVKDSSLLLQPLGVPLTLPLKARRWPGRSSTMPSLAWKVAPSLATCPLEGQGHPNLQVAVIHQPGQQLSPPSLLVPAPRLHIPERERPHQVIASLCSTGGPLAMAALSRRLRKTR